MSEKHPHLGPWTLLKTPSGTCPECAVTHAEGAPHNAQSLAYQYDFFGKNGRWPTWGDALAHCSPEVQAAWKEGLLAKGVRPEQLEPSRPEQASAGAGTAQPA